MAVEYGQLKQNILQIAKAMAEKGAGYAQEAVVLRAAEKQYIAEQQPSDHQQALPRWRLILTAWHDLFRDGELSWGYDLDNPNAPFFHVPVRSSHKEPAAAS